MMPIPQSQQRFVDFEGSCLENTMVFKKASQPLSCWVSGKCSFVTELIKG